MLGAKLRPRHHRQTHPELPLHIVNVSGAKPPPTLKVRSSASGVSEEYFRIKISRGKNTTMSVMSIIKSSDKSDSFPSANKGMPAGGGGRTTEGTVWMKMDCPGMREVQRSGRGWGMLGYESGVK